MIGKIIDWEWLGTEWKPTSGFLRPISTLSHLKKIQWIHLFVFILVKCLLFNGKVGGCIHLSKKEAYILKKHNKTTFEDFLCETGTLFWEPNILYSDLNQAASNVQDQWYSDYSESSLEFPPPKDININMMPFILASDFGSSKLPKYLKPYWSFIHKCSSREQK